MRLGSSGFARPYPRFSMCHIVRLRKTGDAAGHKPVVVVFAYIYINTCMCKLYLHICVLYLLLLLLLVVVVVVGCCWLLLVVVVVGCCCCWLLLLLLSSC